MKIVILCLSLILKVNSEYYDTYTGKEISKERYESLRQLNLVPFCAMEVEPCDESAPRRLDLTCNNLHRPTRGAFLTPFIRMLPASFPPNGNISTSKYGRPLPNARRIRVALMSDGRASSKHFTHAVTHVTVFYIGDMTTVHDTVNYVVLKTTCCQPAGAADPDCIPIRVPDDDLHLRYSDVNCLNLTRPITFQDLGCVGKEEPPARLNLAAPMLDLSVVYGHDGPNAARERAPGGRLRSELLQGKEWPPNGGSVCVLNRLPQETRCHDTSVGGVNSLVGGNLVSMWFYRQHNYIADTLAKLNPCWDDDEVYYRAREINIAFANQMLYYELLPLILGYDYMIERELITPYSGYLDDYSPRLEPGVSIEMVTFTRWFHVIQEGRYKLYTNKGKLFDEVNVVEFTLRTGALPNNNTIQGMTQGAFRQPMAGADMLVDPDMGERSLGPLQRVSDVISADIMKGRANGLPPYNEYRKACGLKVAHSFEDLKEYMSQNSVDAISRNYESVDDLDAYVGILAEYPMKNAMVGETLACVMAEQYLRFRRSDRFWYEHYEYNPRPFTQEQLSTIREFTLAKLFCAHGDDVIEVQPHAFRLPGHGNEITDCKNLPFPNLAAFRDRECDSPRRGVASGKSIKLLDKDIQTFLDYVHPLNRGKGDTL